MPGPFPGMDPYLECHWGDIHARMVLYACDQLQRRLPGDLRARVEERVFIEDDAEYFRKIVPDVRVFETARPTWSNSGGGVAVMEDIEIAEPVVLNEEIAIENYLQIIDIASGGRVVTVIEVLSETNKLPNTQGFEMHARKRRETLGGGANFVEIDLLRTGGHNFGCFRDGVPSKLQAEYAACVRRAREPMRFEYYPLRLRKRLPAFRIPLRPADDDVLLNLQALVDLAYDNGAYTDIDYSLPPVPPLDHDDEVWARRLLKEKGVVS